MLPLLFTTCIFGVHVLNEDWDNALATMLYGMFLIHVPEWLQYALVMPVVVLHGLGWLGEAVVVNGLTLD